MNAMHKFIFNDAESWGIYVERPGAEAVAEEMTLKFNEGVRDAFLAMANGVAPAAAAQAMVAAFRREREAHEAYGATDTAVREVADHYLRSVFGGLVACDGAPACPPWGLYDEVDGHEAATSRLDAAFAAARSEAFRAMANGGSATDAASGIVSAMEAEMNELSEFGASDSDTHRVLQRSIEQMFGANWNRTASPRARVG